jgi:hypothetical protein
MHRGSISPGPIIQTPVIPFTSEDISSIQHVSSEGKELLTRLNKLDYDTQGIIIGKLIEIIYKDRVPILTLERNGEEAGSDESIRLEDINKITNKTKLVENVLTTYEFNIPPIYVTNLKLINMPIDKCPESLLEKITTIKSKINIGFVNINCSVTGKNYNYAGIDINVYNDTIHLEMYYRLLEGNSYKITKENVTNINFINEFQNLVASLNTYITDLLQLEVIIDIEAIEMSHDQANSIFRAIHALEARGGNVRKQQKYTSTGIRHKCKDGTVRTLYKSSNNQLRVRTLIDGKYQFVGKKLIGAQINK